MIAHKFSLVLSVSTLALLGACAGNPKHHEPVAEAPGVSSSSLVEFGRVNRIETMSMATRPSGGGAVLGAVIGAVIGNQIGSGNGRAAATGLGAVGGAVIGNNVERRNDNNEPNIYRVSVRLDNGRVELFDYQRIDDLRVGDRVRVEAGLLYRT